MKVYVFGDDEFIRQLEWALGRELIHSSHELGIKNSQNILVLIDLEYLVKKQLNLGELLRKFSKKTPIIVFTSLNRNEFKEKLLEEFEITHIEKKGDVEPLLEKVRKILSKYGEVLQ